MGSNPTLSAKMYSETVQVGSEKKRKSPWNNTPRVFFRLEGPRWFVAIRSTEGYFWGYAFCLQY
uniref:Uncharacterized protein n=1 Tax=Ralstonia solanacearum TaxID=305 RepID=A0A0S4V3E9_RALSL|nr:protein of unknown function [Ralstonia solanacearum]